MRDEISEPQQWRSSRQRNSGAKNVWVARRKASVQTSETMPTLAGDVVDAAFADESIALEPVRGSRRDLASDENASQISTGQPTESAHLLQDISAQLAMLQTQQEHLQKLLDQVQK